MRILIQILIATLAVMTLPVVAATVTPGTSCKKAGLTKVSNGKKFTCIKLGKKLYWDNGKKLPSKATPTSSPTLTSPTSPTPTSSPTLTSPTSPTPTSSPTLISPSIPTPTSTYSGAIDLYGNPTSDEALKIDGLIEQAWARGKPATEYIKVRAHEKVKGSLWARDNEAIMPAITKILDGVGAPLTRNVDWFIWWDLSSLQPLLPNYCWAKDSKAFDPKSVGAGYCRPSTIFIFFDAYQQWYPKDGFLEKYPNDWDKYGISAVAAGEIAHFAQQLYGEKFGHEAHNFYPAWLREGPTVLYASMAYSKWANIPYSTVRNLALKHNGNPRCKNVLMTDLLMFNTSPNLCEYSGGFLAVEYLVAKTGDLAAPFRYLESKMKGNGKVCENPHSICRDSYEEVIREIYSKDVDAWHNEIQAYVRKWALE